MKLGFDIVVYDGIYSSIVFFRSGLYNRVASCNVQLNFVSIYTMDILAKFVKSKKDLQ